jgi:hypothetical protein
MRSAVGRPRSPGDSGALFRLDKIQNDRIRHQATQHEYDNTRDAALAPAAPGDPDD